jgi:hypothetical protein
MVEVTSGHVNRGQRQTPQSTSDGDPEPKVQLAMSDGGHDPRGHMLLPDRSCVINKSVK